MLGQVVYQRDGKGTKVVRAPLHGVPVLRVALDPEGFWARRRAGRAARRLVRQGAARVLVPEDFPFWEELSRAGLRPVDPLPLLRSCAAPMALALLRRQGEDPLRAAVALRGSRAERDLVRAAEELCPRVRDLCLSVQTGGGELERYLHRQYGVALRPDWDGVQAAIRFDPRAEEAGQAVLLEIAGNDKDRITYADFRHAIRAAGAAVILWGVGHRRLSFLFISFFSCPIFSCAVAFRKLLPVKRTGEHISIRRS